MPRLFSYGSLQRAEVQQATFGRSLAGGSDELLDFVLVPAGAHSPHANVVRRAGSRVAGQAFEVSEAELALADEYEARDAYIRIAGRLVSGRDTWVYVSRSTA